uniref:Uncharacterized protein n=1 Tax=Anguilla anguilla TaxID=7936 RepID=A0A0E9PSN3_ANGAN
MIVSLLDELGDLSMWSPTHMCKAIQFHSDFCRLNN